MTPGSPSSASTRRRQRLRRPTPPGPRPQAGRPHRHAAAARRRPGRGSPSATWPRRLPGCRGRLAGFRRSPATPLPSSRRRPDRRGRGGRGPAAPRRPGARSGRRPSSRRPTSSRPGWCAPRRPWDCGCRRTSASPASTASTLPWLDHVLTTVEQPGADEGPGDGSARAAGPGRAADRDEPFPVRLRVGTTTSSPPAATPEVTEPVQPRRAVGASWPLGMLRPPGTVRPPRVAVGEPGPDEVVPAGTVACPG